jgi:hypothetical protein
VVAAGLAAATLLCGCGSSSAGRTTQTAPPPARVLDAATGKRLAHWFDRLRACFAERELLPGPVVVTRRRLAVTVDAVVPPSIVTGDTLSCAEALGKPPAHASLRAQRGHVILLLPPGTLLPAR